MGRKINYYLQWFWILLFAFNTLFGFLIKVNWNEGYEVFYYAVGFWMSLTHIFSSFIHFLRHGKASELLPHLKAGCIIALGWMAVFYFNDFIQYDWDGDFLYRFVAVVPLALLALYYWHVTFTDLHPDQLKDHSFLDLE